MALDGHCNGTERQISNVSGVPPIIILLISAMIADSVDITYVFKMHTSCCIRYVFEMQFERELSLQRLLHEVTFLFLWCLRF